MTDNIERIGSSALIGFMGGAILTNGLFAGPNNLAFMVFGGIAGATICGLAEYRKIKGAK